MARVETLTKIERYDCGFCGKEISDAAGYTTVAIVGGDGEEWHTNCAEGAGVLLDDEDEDEEFDHDPEYDGEEDDE